MTYQHDFTIKDGIIQDPGKFEGEPLYTHYFYGCYLDGNSDDELEDGTLVFYPTNEEKDSFYPLLNDIHTVYLWEDNQGFIHTWTNTEAEEKEQPN